MVGGIIALIGVSLLFDSEHNYYLTGVSLLFDSKHNCY